MKQPITYRQTLLLTAVLYAFIFGFAACQHPIDNPSFSCPDMDMTASINGQTRKMMQTNSILFRQETDSGGLKYWSMESISDSFKIVLNVTDGMFSQDAIKNDTIRLDTFTFRRGSTNPIHKGLVMAGIYNANGSYDFLNTDSSAIIIRWINTKRQLISGSFFFTGDNQRITGSGTFNSACYITQ